MLLRKQKGLPLSAKEMDGNFLALSNRLTLNTTQDIYGGKFFTDMNIIDPLNTDSSNHLVSTKFVNDNINAVFTKRLTKTTNQTINVLSSFSSINVPSNTTFNKLALTDVDWEDVAYTRSTTTISEAIPVNPDNAPANNTWVQISSTTPRTVLQVFKYANGSWDLGQWNRNIISVGYSNGFSITSLGVANSGFDTNLYPNAINQFYWTSFYGYNSVKTIPETQKMNIMYNGIFDINLFHYSWSSDRTNGYVRMYDSTLTLLGYLYYTKDSSTWSTADYSTIRFYNAQGTMLIDISAANFSGTTYGNGCVSGTFDFRDPTKLVVLYPRTYRASIPTHVQGVDRTFTFNHPFANTAYISLELFNFNNTYSGSGSTFAAIGSKFSLHNRVDGYY